MIDIGTVPWNDDEMRAAYPAFKELYQNSPVRDNSGGMKAPQAFLTWFMFSKLQPKLIIESGIWKGQGTWLIEQACPQAQLICIDINLSRLIYRSSKAQYFDQDFDLVDFSSYDLTDAICFFDDHQNALKRLKEMKWKGFKRAIFEDNYPTKQGDCYSPKKVLSETGYYPKIPSNVSWKQMLKQQVKQIITNAKSQIVPKNKTHKKELLQHTHVYYEGPPLYRTAKTRWGDDWSDQEYPTKPALFRNQPEDPLFIEATNYNWLCYIELK